MDSARRPDALLAVELSERTGARSPSRSLIAAEREQAIRDLQATASFRPSGLDGPFRLRLGVERGSLALDVRDRADRPLRLVGLSLGPFRRVLADYWMIVDAHEEASRAGSSARLQTIDMGRRVLHDEGAALLADRLRGRIDIDHETARRLFTLLAMLSAHR